MTGVDKAILDHVDKNGGAPSIFKVSVEIGSPYYWVHTRCKKLEAMGLIKIYSFGAGRASKLALAPLAPPPVSENVGTQDTVHK